MADDLVPRPTHVQELIALHPREYALVSARMLAVASVVAIALSLHTALSSSQTLVRRQSRCCRARASAAS